MSKVCPAPKIWAKILSLTKAKTWETTAERPSTTAALFKLSTGPPNTLVRRATTDASDYTERYRPLDLREPRSHSDHPGQSLRQVRASLEPQHSPPPGRQPLPLGCKRECSLASFSYR